MMLTFTLLVLAVHSVMSQDVANNMGGRKGIPMALYNKAHSYLRNARSFKSFTLQDTIQYVNDLATWEAPNELKKKFPYSLSGYDYQDRPVWVAEVGKYNVREQVERGEEATQNLTKYVFQAGLRKLESMMVKDTPTREVRQVLLISDWEGFDIAQGTHTPKSYLTTNGIASIKHLLGDGVFEKAEFIGEDEEKIQAALKKLMPESAIPPWYGGRQDYKPLAVYG